MCVARKIEPAYCEICQNKTPLNDNQVDEVPEYPDPSFSFSHQLAITLGIGGSGRGWSTDPECSSPESSTDSVVMDSPNLVPEAPEI